MNIIIDFNNILNLLHCLYLLHLYNTTLKQLSCVNYLPNVFYIQVCLGGIEVLRTSKQKKNKEKVETKLG